MFLMENKTSNMLGSNASLTQDGEMDVDALFSSLTDGRLAERIMDAARLAVAQHMLQQAQEMQPAVEAENSAQ